MKKKAPLSRTLGKLLASTQSIVDDLVSLGFKKMKSAAKEAPPAKEPETLKEKGASALRQAAGFLGDTGEAFYEHYEKLKAKKVKRAGEKNR